jgi:O-acetyl-ADP-ribose deacetylase (regulator of RNase III)
MGSKGWVILVAAAAGLLLAGVALADKEQIHFTAAGQLAARAAVLSRADVGSAPGWTVKTRKPDLSGATGCANFNPKQSDLVLTGAAEAEWSRLGLDLESSAQVLQTPAMVKLDWQRTGEAADAQACLRENFQKQATAAARFVSFAKVAFPAVATYTLAFRAVFDYTQGTNTVPVAVDLVFVGRGHTEITLTTTAPLATGPAVKTLEIRLARALAARAY